LDEFVLADIFKMLYTECHILNSIALSTKIWYGYQKINIV